MKIRAVFRRGAHLPPTNVEITADGTATVADVAVALARSPEAGVAWPEGRPVTLRDNSADRHRTLAPSQSLVHSGLRSGALLDLVAPVGLTEDAPGARLLVLDGPDAGTEVLVRLGRSTIGRSSSNDVRLNDPRVSKLHAHLEVDDRIEVIDQNSANGVIVGGTPVARAVLGSGDRFIVGSSMLQVQQLRASQGATPSTTDIEFIRSPRVLERPDEQELEAPKVPGNPLPHPFPLLAMVAPLIMGALLYLFTRNPMSIVFVALSPLLMIGTWASQAIQTRKQKRLAREEFAAELEAIDQTLGRSGDLQRAQLEAMYPSLAECVASVGTLDDKVWSRRPEHPEFLCLRLGVGDVSAAVRLKEESSREGMPDLRRALDEVRMKRVLVHRAPVTVSLSESGNLGVCGDTLSAPQVARGLALQLAITHSPAEVVLVCLTSPAGLERWRWLEWLPHTNSPQCPIGPLQLSSDGVSTRRVADAIDELMERRLAGSSNRATRGPRTTAPQGATSQLLPAVVVFVDDPQIERNRLARIAELGPDASVHVVWAAPSKMGLPAACRTYIEVSESVSRVGMVREERLVSPFEAEGADTETAMYVAKLLTPVVDSSALLEDESDLPAAISMGALIGGELMDDPDQVLSRWRENSSLIDHHGPAVPRHARLSLRAVVGHTGLEPFTLDLRSQGPHALVGGTTGAGKSEFLQAWVLGMAQAISPDRLAFLFVDYKGGAAFARCVELPHSVGLVTDLSPYLVRRTLTSLKAEIHRREVMLNAKSAKDLIELEMRGDPECPPALVIIIDEFAALKTEVPEFVDGVIDIAQRGRSLGMHLIMATQRPAGVITDNIRANTNLRISLRMNDVSDSNDVLGDPMAAYFDPALPGRGAARVGPGRLLKFQGAYPAARTGRQNLGSPVDVAQFDFGLKAQWRVPRPEAQSAEVDQDIERMVRTLREACVRAEVPAPHRPWVEGLASAYDLVKLRQRRDDEILLGVVDDPEHQRHFTDYFRPDIDGNILYVGAGGAGKTTALRSLAIASAITPRTGPVHVYGIDFSGRGLAALEEMPNVGSIISGRDSERVARLIRLLADIVDERAMRFAAANASSLPEYRQHSGRNDEPRYLVLIDGFGSFAKDYNDGGAQEYALFSTLARVMADGRGYGVHFAATVDRPNAIPTTVAPAFQRRVVLRQSSETAYLDLGVPRDVLGASSPPGRALQVHNPQELQIVTLGGRAQVVDQNREMKELADSLRSRHVDRPTAVRSLPTLIRRSELPASRPGSPIIGMADDTLQEWPAVAQGTVLVGGGAASGKSNALAVYAASLREAVPGIRLTHMTPTSSSIAGIRVWDRSAIGLAEVTSLAEAEKPVDTGTRPALPRQAFFVEGAAEIAAAGFGDLLTSLARACVASGDLFVAESTSEQWSKAYELLNFLKSNGTALLLEPGEDDGYPLVNAQLPRFKKSEMVTGRGFWIHRGRAVKLQVPVHGQ